jgi:hypothetical protein
MRDESQHQDDTFIEPKVLLAHQAGIFGIVVFEIRRGYVGNASVLALLAEVQGDTRTQYFVEPAELAIQCRGVIRGRGAAPEGLRGSRRKCGVEHRIFCLCRLTWCDDRSGSTPSLIGAMRRSHLQSS